jgi:hypothetical protein
MQSVGHDYRRPRAFEIVVTVDQKIVWQLSGERGEGEDSRAPL